MVIESAVGAIKGEVRVDEWLEGLKDGLEDGEKPEESIQIIKNEMENKINQRSETKRSNHIWI